MYVRGGSMVLACLGGKIGHADLDAAARAGGPHVRDLAPPDEPREVALDVPRDAGSLGEVHDPVSFREECGFDLGRRPLEGASGALGAEGRTELRGLGADVGDCLVNSAAIRTQKDTPPKESCSSGGVLRVGDYARVGGEKSRPDGSLGSLGARTVCGVTGLPIA